jgi:ribulose-5-phosphate 4-epimerase/fuculose-1-phosphate aldolase
MKFPTLAQIPRRTIRSFLEAAHETARQRLVSCSSGNLSCRLDENLLLIKSSRAWLERLSPGDISLCRIADGMLVDGPKPSVEIGFHAGIMRIRPEAHTVLHFQSPWATALACRSDVRRLSFDITPEVPYYIGPIGHVPFHMPGSSELADAVVASARRHTLILMHNHGEVTFGSSFEETLQRAMFFEMTAFLILQGGRRLKPLPMRTAHALMALSSRKNSSSA